MQSSRPRTMSGSRPVTRAAGTMSGLVSDMEIEDPRGSKMEFVMISEAEATKEYMSERKIPQMMDSLLSSLMMERPDDHIEFLLEKLDKIEEIGPEKVNWETFIWNMHPYRDQLRLELIEDDSKFQKEHKEKKAKEEKEKSENYSPDVFRLTETEIQ